MNKLVEEEIHAGGAGIHSRESKSPREFLHGDFLIYTLRITQNQALDSVQYISPGFLSTVH